MRDWAERLGRAVIRKVDQAISDPSIPSTEDSTAKAVEPSEACWSAALSEFEGSDRRPGLWAKALARAAGNEALAKSEYLRVRAQELHSIAEAERADQRREADRSRAAADYARLADGEFSNHRVVEICEAQLRALGFEVVRPRADKWEVRRGTATNYAHSVDELRRLADAYSAQGLRRGSAGAARGAA